MSSTGCGVTERKRRTTRDDTGASPSSRLFRSWASLRPVLSLSITGGASRLSEATFKVYIHFTISSGPPRRACLRPTSTHRRLLISDDRNNYFTLQLKFNSNAYPPKLRLRSRAAFPRARARAHPPFARSRREIRHHSGIPAIY